MITPCNPVIIELKENVDDFSIFIKNSKKIIEYVLYEQKEKSLLDDKFSVIIGSVTYVIKIFEEICSRKLGNSILGRHGIRTIIEVFIMLKYLMKNELKKPSIWQEYKIYGISKYKLPLLKARELKENKTSHFIAPIIDVLVNEFKWEEFIDIDLKYFDKLGIREKSMEVDEKELYDLYYDYDSNFAHGLWGAIRESSMLHCNNACHQYHSLPDLDSKQLLPDVISDCILIIGKVFNLFGSIYQVPEILLKELGCLK